MKFMQLVVGLILGWLLSATALAQSTLGELVAAGGKQLSKEEVLATLRGATLSGLTLTGGETQVEYKENGSASGYVTNATGTRGALFGTWTVDDTARVCRDLTLRFRETMQLKDCFRVYGLADQVYFPATASTDPSTAVLKRTIKR